MVSYIWGVRVCVCHVHGLLTTICFPVNGGVLSTKVFSPHPISPTLADFGRAVNIPVVARQR